LAKHTYQQQIVIKDLSQHSMVYLVPLADWHIGDRNSALDIIQGYIDWIAERDNAFTVLNGDLMNAAWKDSTPELYDDLITPDQGYAKVLELCQPIKDKILMITRGNHEESIYRKVGHDYMYQLAHDLGDIPYKPDGGMVGMRLRKNGTHMFCWAYAVHGWGGARTIGAKVKKTQDLMMIANAHIFVLSHDHTQNVNRGNVLDPPVTNIRADKPVYLQTRRKLFINTGGFIRYGGYIQRKGYVPQDLGTPRIRIELKQSTVEGYHIDLHGSI
jgi:hypothetical protein